jgi:type II secretory pathway pseudopilin PulG
MAVLAVIVILAAVAAFAIVLVRFNRKRLHVARCAGRASPEQLERIYGLVEQLGTVPATGYVLARTNKSTSETRCLIPIPTGLPEFPWAGRIIEVTVAPRDVEFQFVDAPVGEPTLLGHVYRPVRVPRHQTKRSAKERNTFSPERYVVNNPPLLAALTAVCRQYPGELLSYLLCAGQSSFEFEPIDQARIGTSPAWVQDPEPQICDECKGRMHLVLQLPGTVISTKAFRSGTFYLFGCIRHPHRTKSLGQFT